MHLIYFTKYLNIEIGKNYFGSQISVEASKNLIGRQKKKNKRQPRQMNKINQPKSKYKNESAAFVKMKRTYLTKNTESLASALINQLFPTEPHIRK